MVLTCSFYLRLFAAVTRGKALRYSLASSSITFSMPLTTNVNRS